MPRQLSAPVMNPDSPIDPRAAIESNLTALLLGELPHEQAAALHQKLAQDAELAKLYERLKHTISLVRETVASPAVQASAPPVLLKLSEERRQRLLQQFKTVAPKEFVHPRRRAMPWLVPVGIAAAFVVLLGGLLVPAFSRAKSKGQNLASHTWSLAEPAAPVLHNQLTHPSKRDSQDLNGRLDQVAAGIQDTRAGTPAALSLPAAAPPAPAAGTAIVLPKAAELADATTPTPPTAGTMSAGAPVRAFYDDSSGRAVGGPGGGFGGGGFGGATSSSAANSLGAAQRQYPNNLTAGDAYFSTDSETRRVVTLDQLGAAGGGGAAGKSSAGRVAEPDSDKSRKEVTGAFDLANADPQDVYNNLGELFNRSSVRQNNNPNALMGQSNPLSQRVRNNTPSSSAGASSGFGGMMGGGMAGGGVIGGGGGSADASALAARPEGNVAANLLFHANSPFFQPVNKDVLGSWEARVRTRAVAGSWGTYLAAANCRRSRPCRRERGEQERGDPGTRRKAVVVHATTRCGGIPSPVQSCSSTRARADAWR